MTKIRYTLQEMRLYQWIKNLLIFAPLIFVNELFNFSLLWKTVIAFFSFSFMASSVYILNDIFDLVKDKIHPQKKERPLASGKINLKTAKISFIFLFILSTLVGVFINWSFLFILFFYFFLNLLYSYRELVNFRTKIDPKKQFKEFDLSIVKSKF